MELSSHAITALVKLVQIGSYSRAAVSLGITQPALTKRIQVLESQLGQPLVVRGRKGVQLTEGGREVLRYAETVSHLENNLLMRFGVSGTELVAPLLRVGGSASLMFPVVIPALAPLTKAHDNSTVEFYVRENKELKTMLLRGQVDYLVTDQGVDRPDCETVLIGNETIVAIESSGCRKNVFIDAEVNDDFTERYIGKVIGKRMKYRRAFMQDEYGIIEGVRHGYGRALVHVHMVSRTTGLSLVGGSKSLKVPVFVIFRKQATYNHWHDQILKLLKDFAPKALEGKLG